MIFSVLSVVVAFAGAGVPGVGDVFPMGPTMAYGAVPHIILFKHQRTLLTTHTHVTTSLVGSLHFTWPRPDCGKRPRDRLSRLSVSEHCIVAGMRRHPSSNRFTRMKLQLAQQQQLLPRLPAATEKGGVGEQPSRFPESLSRRNFSLLRGSFSREVSYVTNATGSDH